MKIPLLLAVFHAFLISIQGQSQTPVSNKKFRLEATITNADSLTEATVFAMGIVRFTQNKVRIENRKFVLEGEVDKPGLAIINTNKVRGGIGAWITSGLIKVTFEVRKDEKGYSLLQPITVEGPQESIDFLAQINLQNKIALSDLPELKMHMLISENTENYIKKHRHSYLSLFFLTTTLQILGTAKAKDLFTTLADSLQSSEEGILLKEEIEKAEKNAIGKTVPDFNMNDINGQLVHLSTAVKGPTLLVFWASWCGPCRHENSLLVKNQKKLDEKSVQLIGVSLDDDKKDWLRAIEKDKINHWLHLSSLKGGFKSDIAKEFKITGIPYLLLIDKDLKIRAVDYYEAMKLINAM
jgi:thiol-disulfide isomerase/thioredoxin